MYPSTPLMFPGESLAGYLFRVAEENGYPTSSWVATDAGIHHCGVQPEEAAFSRLEELTGKSVEQLRRASNQDVSKNSSTVLGHTLRYTDVTRFSMRYCHECLGGGGYHKHIWNVSAADCCPIHECALIDSCPICTSEVKLRWERPTLLKCPNGHDLLKAKKKPGRVEQPRLLLSKMLYEKLGEDCSWAPVLSMLPQPIAGLTPGQILEMLPLLVAVFKLGVQETGRSASAQYDAELWRETLLLPTWPEGFRARLTAALKRSIAGEAIFLDQPHKIRLKAQFCGAGEAADMILREINHVFQENQIHSEADWLGDGKKRIGLKQASGKVIMNHQKFLRIVNQTGHKIYVAPTGKRRYIDVEALEKIKRDIKRTAVPEYIIRDEVGTAVLVVRQLILRGAFGEEAACRKGFDNREVTNVYKEEVQDFKKRVNKAIKRHKNVGANLTFPGLRISFHSAKITLPDVIMALLAGEIRAVSGNADRLGKIHYVRDDLLALLRQIEGAVVPKTRTKRDAIAG